MHYTYALTFFKKHKNSFNNVNVVRFYCCGSLVVLGQKLINFGHLKFNFLQFSGTERLSGFFCFLFLFFNCVRVKCCGLFFEVCQVFDKFL